MKWAMYTAVVAIRRRHYAATPAPMRDRKCRTVTAIKPEALRIAVGGGERVGGGDRKRKSREPAERRVGRESVLPDYSDR